MMKGMLLLLFSALFILTSSSCSKAESPDQEINEDIQQILFFSDEANYRQEVAYYDAIIELKQKYPEAIKNMKIIYENKKQYLDQFELERSPAMVLVYEDQTLVKVDGIVKKDQIIEPIENALEQYE
ncbi:MAG: small peptidoglycan-associated lipoprotein [Cytobacillus gottheilii]|uniref:small peptidoglycan-associated lipoprotein n=1 Tax=Cytobacillus gottheilii TaxID=859144 RepID=UPI003464BBAE